MCVYFFSVTTLIMHVIYYVPYTIHTQWKITFSYYTLFLSFYAKSKCYFPVTGKAQKRTHVGVVGPMVSTDNTIALVLYNTYYLFKIVAVSCSVGSICNGTKKCIVPYMGIVKHFVLFISILNLMIKHVYCSFQYRV